MFNKKTEPNAANTMAMQAIKLQAFEFPNQYVVSAAPRLLHVGRLVTVIGGSISFDDYCQA